MDELKVFTGNAHPALAQAVVDYLGIPLGQCEVFEFSNGNIFVRILENVRQRDIFVIQPLCRPVNKSLVELLIMIQAFFNIPVDELTALYLLSDYARNKNLDDLVVVATDIGITKRARDLAAK